MDRQESGQDSEKTDRGRLSIFKISVTKRIVIGCSVLLVSIVTAVCTTLVLQTNDRVVNCTLPKADIVVVLDSSSSVGKTNFDQMKTFSKTFLMNAKKHMNDTRVGLLTYNTDAFIEFNLNSMALERIDQIPYSMGITNTAKALKTVREEMFTAENGDRDDAPDFMLVLTDGVSIDPAMTLMEAKLTHAAGIHVYVLGIGLADRQEVNRIASFPASKYVTDLPDFADLLRLGFAIFEAFCTDLGMERLQDDIDSKTKDEISIRRSSKFKPPICISKIDLAFVVDSSSSISMKEFQMQMAFVYDIVDFLEIGDQYSRVSALSFSSKVVPEFQFHTYDKKDEVLRAIDNISYTGVTESRLDQALRDTHQHVFNQENGERSNVIDIVVVLTGADVNSARYDTQKEAANIKSRPSYIFVIGIGDVEEEILNGISSDPDETYTIIVSNTRQLNTEDVKQRLLYRICVAAEVIPFYTSTTLPQTFQTTQEQRSDTVTNTFLTAPITTSLPKNTTGKPASCGMEKLDIVFILDSSTSVGSHNFENIRRILRDLVIRFDIDSGKVRFGVLTYSTTVKAIFYLNTYNTTDQILEAIRTIPYRYGSTNTADALELLRMVMFTATNGDRKDAQNIGILFTDGISNINSRRTIPEAKQCRNDGIFMFVVGIDLYDTGEIEAIATRRESSFHVPDFSYLRDWDGISRKDIGFDGCDDPPMVMGTECVFGWTDSRTLVRFTTMNTNTMDLFDYCPVSFCTGKNNWSAVNISKSAQECYTTGTHGAQYTGKNTCTITGQACQRWDTDHPHERNKKHIPKNVTDIHSNYCRDPGPPYDGKPWCYTTDSAIRWDYCHVQLC